MTSHYVDDDVVVTGLLPLRLLVLQPGGPVRAGNCPGKRVN